MLGDVGMRARELLMYLGLCPLLIGASEPVRFQPSSQWVLDYYADDSCRLIRQFGEGKDQVKLTFESVAPGGMTLLVLGGTLRRTINAKPINAKFLPDGGIGFGGRTALTEGGNKAAAFWLNVPFAPVGKGDDERLIDKKTRAAAKERSTIDPVESATEKAERATFAKNTTGLSIAQPGARAMILETGSLGKALRMFDECERDLLRQWGVDPDQQDQIVKPVWAPSMTAWFSSSDYPNEMLRQKAESDVSVRLVIDAAGKVIKCAAVSAYVAPEFNKVVCNVYLTRAKFAPAELANGTKVVSYLGERIRFRMP